MTKKKSEELEEKKDDLKANDPVETPEKEPVEKVKNKKTKQTLAVKLSESGHITVLIDGKVKAPSLANSYCHREGYKNTFDLSMALKLKRGKTIFGVIVHQVGGSLY